MKINITYRRKKSGMSMRVSKTGDINVSVPYGTPKAVVLDFVERNRDWIDRARARMAEAIERENNFFDRLPLTTADECREATERLNRIIPPLVAKYESLMGVHASRISYKRNKTRWGSCNHRTRHLNFSAYLLLLPDWCIEHVVVHELAHIIVPNHGADFHAVMDYYFPRWREARAETIRISRLSSPD